MTDVKDVLDEVGRRLRDEGQTGITNTQLRTLLDAACRNLSRQVSRAESTIQLIPNHAIYELPEAVVNTHAAIDQVRLDDEVLDEVPWDQLCTSHPDWLTRHGTPQYWSRYGWNILVVTPTPVVAATLHLHGPSAELASDELIQRFGSSLEVVVSLTQGLALLQARRFEAAAAAVSRVS